MAYKTWPKRLEEFSAKWVPGLRVYLRREQRRDFNKLVRDELALKLEEVKEVLDRSKKRRVDQGSLKHLDLLDRATRKVEKVRDTIKFNSRGYRGLFDIEEVAERELDALIAFDQGLFQTVADLKSAADQAGSLPDAELADALYEFEGRVDKMDASLSEREQFSTATFPQA